MFCGVVIWVVGDVWWWWDQISLRILLLVLLILLVGCQFRWWQKLCECECGLVEQVRNSCWWLVLWVRLIMFCSSWWLMSWFLQFGSRVSISILLLLWLVKQQLVMCLLFQVMWLIELFWVMLVVQLFIVMFCFVSWVVLKVFLWVCLCRLMQVVVFLGWVLWMNIGMQGIFVVIGCLVFVWCMELMCRVDGDWMEVLQQQGQGGLVLLMLMLFGGVVVKGFQQVFVFWLVIVDGEVFYGEVVDLVSQCCQYQVQLCVLVVQLLVEYCYCQY